MQPGSGPSGTLYERILLVLLEQIRSGQLGVGAKLPTEAELTEQYGVSRTTARRALDELRRRGLVERQAGRGTFVANPKLQPDEAYLTSFTDEIERRGFRPGTRMLSDEAAVGEPAVLGRLRLPAGTTVRRVRRVRTADDHPIFVCDSGLNTATFPALAGVDPGAGSLYRAMEDAIGRRVSRAEQWVCAAAADDVVAGLLGLRPGTPVLVVERVTYVPARLPLHPDEPLEHVVAHFHPDRYRIFAELTPRPAVPPRALRQPAGRRTS